jgi:N-methylhydantoinase A/oxoprolinase/acetone carboxylase beta subunit
MFLGIDVGGTHTDAVLLDETSVNKVYPMATAKAKTSYRLIDSLSTIFDELLAGDRLSKLTRLTVSSTLGLNSLLTNSADPVGILTTGGPGLALDAESWGPLFKALSGQQDHRGHVLKTVDPAEAKSAANELLLLGASSLVVASKFGPKNPELEDIMLKAASQATSGPVMAASKLFGGLNFPRRLGGSVLNAAVKRLYDRFINDLIEISTNRGLKCPIYILKADGGVMSLEAARERPVLALAAGPAASLLGLWALSDPGAQEDVLMIDMGGTSTDLAVISHGYPLQTSVGLTLAGRPTLVRGLMTHSIALGGDTDLVPEDGRLVPKPKRRGPALSLVPDDLGQRPPTLTDVLNVLGYCAIGDPAISKKALEEIAPGKSEELAREALVTVLTKLKTEAEAFIDRINQQPVYTIKDFSVNWRISPKKAVFLGGPAETLAPLADKILGMPTSAPTGAATANALGAALAKPTVEAELYADTDHGLMSAPTLGKQKKINSSYDLEMAKRDLLELMGGSNDLKITATECFSQFSEYGRAGKVIKVSAQSTPGLVARLASPTKPLTVTSPTDTVKPVLESNIEPILYS